MQVSHFFHDNTVTNFRIAALDSGQFAVRATFTEAGQRAGEICFYGTDEQLRDFFAGLLAQLPEEKPANTPHPFDCNCDGCILAGVYSRA